MYIIHACSQLHLIVSSPDMAARQKQTLVYQLLQNEDVHSVRYYSDVVWGCSWTLQSHVS